MTRTHIIAVCLIFVGFTSTYASHNLSVNGNNSIPGTESAFTPPITSGESSSEKPGNPARIQGTSKPHTVSTDEIKTIEKWLKEGAERLQFHQNEYPDVSRNELVSMLADFYSRKHLGITYVGGLLEVPEQETLVVTLEGSDCVLFVEHAMAMTMTTMQGGSSFDQFAGNLALFRYGDGKIDGYASRLHYFSDWLRTNQEKGRITLLFQDESLPTIGPLNFMTTNRSSYRQLAASDSLYKLIADRQKELNSKQKLRYIPQDDIPAFEGQFKTGDILSFVTTINGLDISHTAVVLIEGDRVGFYHASTTDAVIKDPKTIYEYTRDRRNVKGILIARPSF